MPAAVPRSFFFAGEGDGSGGRKRREEGGGEEEGVWEEDGLGLSRLEPSRKNVGNFRLGHGIRAEQNIAWWDHLHC